MVDGISRRKVESCVDLVFLSRLWRISKMVDAEHASLEVIDCSSRRTHFYQHTKYFIFAEDHPSKLVVAMICAIVRISALLRVSPCLLLVWFDVILFAGVRNRCLDEEKAS